MRPPPASARVRLAAAIAALSLVEATLVVAIGDADAFRATAVAAILGVVAYHWAVAVVVHPIEVLRAASSRLASGETEVRTGLASHRYEIGYLARDIEAIAAALQARVSMLGTVRATVRDHEQRYRQLFEANPHPMVVFDVETMEILAANDVAVTRYGYSRSQFLRMTVRHLLREATTDDVPTILQRMGLDQDLPAQQQHLRRDGSVIDVEVTSHRLTFAGHPSALAMFADITLRKQAEATGRRRMLALTALYECAQEHAASLSVHEVAESIVRSAVRRFGAASAWLGRTDDAGGIAALASCPVTTAHDQVGADTAAAQTELALRAVRARASVVETPDAVGSLGAGGDCAMVSAAFPLIAQDRAFGVLCLSSWDPGFFATERLGVFASFALHAAAALSNAALHEEVQRTAHILDQRVRERTADLEMANRELEAFSYSVSHDLRAPLRAIDGFTRLAIADPDSVLSAEGRRLLDTVLGSTAEMSRLIDDLLAFSRSARQSLEKHRVAPAGVVESVLRTLQPDTEGRDVEIVVGDLPECEADPALLRQVYQNLLSNALKFTSKREHARIEVGADCDHEEVVYYVRDNGVGLDVGRAERLFGVFQRYHRATDYPGTGVGLAIVHRIVSRHGGRIWVESSPGQGAIFRFTLQGSTEC